MLRSLHLRLLESTVQALDGIAARRQKDAAPHLVTGRDGERAAFFWLRRHGYVVIARGWRSSRVRGDLDLVAWQGETLCFVEVKTRTTRAVAAAQLAVDEDKRRSLRRLARHYLRQCGRDTDEARFDILAIYFEKDKPSDFELFPGAFGWTEAQR